MGNDGESMVMCVRQEREGRTGAEGARLQDDLVYKSSK